MIVINAYAHYTLLFGRAFYSSIAYAYSLRPIPPLARSHTQALNPYGNFNVGCLRAENALVAR